MFKHNPQLAKWVYKLVSTNMGKYTNSLENGLTELRNAKNNGILSQDFDIGN